MIYGDNGSGKSGYARILKRVCRAGTPRGETIHPNIYASRAGTPAAVVDFAADGQNRSTAWSLGGERDPLLSGVSVFDSRTANVHVDEINDVAYTPLPLRMLASLAQACQEVRTRLNQQIAGLEGQTPAVLKTPACEPETAVGALIGSLSGETEIAAVERLAALLPMSSRGLRRSAAPSPLIR